MDHLLLTSQQGRLYHGTAATHRRHRSGVHHAALAPSPPPRGNPHFPHPRPAGKPGRPDGRRWMAALAASAAATDGMTGTGGGLRAGMQGRSTALGGSTAPTWARARSRGPGMRRGRAGKSSGRPKQTAARIAFCTLYIPYTYIHVHETVSAPGAAVPKPTGRRPSAPASAGAGRRRGRARSRPRRRRRPGR